MNHLSKDCGGKVLFYQSKNGIDWAYKKELAFGIEYGSVCECSDLIHFQDGDVLIV